jgi:hypothetical protein
VYEVTDKVTDKETRKKTGCVDEREEVRNCSAFSYNGQPHEKSTNYDVICADKNSNSAKETLMGH